MKKFILSALGLAVTFGMAATSLDLQSRVLLQRRALEKHITTPILPLNQQPFPSLKKKSAFALDRVSDNREATFAFVRIADGFTAEDLENSGMYVLSVRGDIAIVCLPFDRVLEISDSPAIKKMSLQQPLKPLLDKSREASGIDDIHRGLQGLDLPYTGRGVLTGIVDEGLDPNHIAFLDETGKSRVTYLTCFDGTVDKSGTPNYSLYGDSIYDIDYKGNVYWYPTISRFETDKVNSYHGTHTMGILAGGYHGDVTVAKGLSGTSPVFETVKNPYYGVAYDSKIAVSCGELQDACVAYGLNGILDYALYAREVENMPSVISLSLGSSAGPHDPNGLMNRFLQACGEESIIVVAAGNEGDLKIALNKTFSADDNKIATMIYPYGYRYNASAGQGGTNNTYVRNDAVYVYSDDDTPFQLNAFIMTKNDDGSWRRRATFDISSQEGNYFLSDAYYSAYVGGVQNATVARYFDGYIGGGTMLDPDLNRWYGVFDYYLYTNPEYGIAEDGSESVIVGFEVVGEEGQRIDCYCVGYNTWMYNYGVEGYDDGMRNGTISDMAVGKNILVVGAYNQNRFWTSLDGERYGYNEEDGFVIGDIAQYSSYGTLADGRTLPHVCAPGSAVISAMSAPYVEDFFKGHESYIPQNFQAKASLNGKDYYWVAETGTSMSTPLVAGSIALWLEADPTLNVDDVKDIIVKTSIRDEFVEKGNSVQWGAGKFDALAGLKEVIRRASVKDVTVDSKNDRLIFTPLGNNNYNIFVGDASSLSVNVFSLAGNVVFGASYDGCETSVDLSSLTPGIYVVNVNGHSKKLVIK